VFSGQGRPGAGWRRAARYAALAGGILILNVALLDALAALLGSVVFAKVITEVTLFLVSFVVQRHVVFARPAAAPAVPDLRAEGPTVASPALGRSPST
jgi:putative flippase GtrA